MTAEEALREGREALKHLDGGARDARWLLAAALSKSQSALSPSAPVPEDALTRFRAMLAARATRVPVSHLTGEREFYGRAFIVTPDVLDPRPETETLIEAALETPFENVLDLGTGSAAILATLLAERTGATGTGTDVSIGALSVAERNVRKMGVTRRARLIRSNWFETVDGRFDLIVANPPYIAARDMAGLAPELAHEPEIALTDGGDGLSAYRAILRGARDYLSAEGRVIVEFGAGQGAEVAAIAWAAGWSDTTFRADLGGRDRVLVAKSPL